MSLAKFIIKNTNIREKWWRSWLGQYATSQKVAGSIPDAAIEIFY
jgi:hypothetical protein